MSVRGRRLMDDRQVHATDATGGIQIVRYDRAGKWYVEVSENFGGLGLPFERFHVGVHEAARRAIDLEQRGGVIHTGLPGGVAFDRLVRP